MNTETNAKTAEEQIAVFAHEIRNPLALIRANLQYVESSDKKQKSKKNYEIIYREIDRISDILNGCMAKSKTARFEFRCFYISELLGELERIFKQALTVSKIMLILRIENDVEISADYDKLKQVLINVVQNAKESIEAAGNTENGLIEINVSEKAGMLNVRVTDNGIGISEAEIKRIGTPFFSMKEKGCGLGVSISREIIERHKGSFSITGAKNKGASVLIVLPICSPL